SLSCSCRGGEELLEYLGQKLGIRPGQTTPDGRVTRPTAACSGLARAHLTSSRSRSSMLLMFLGFPLRTARTGLCSPMGIVSWTSPFCRARSMYPLSAAMYKSPLRATSI
ncbi:MAG TPA: hypothetical protein EYP14_05305, partial [Planctomycetaceae bacterium]|nr:hypothetical protein [Planctomycetaceae bacterium]